MIIIFVFISLLFLLIGVVFSKELRKNVQLPLNINQTHLNFGFCLKTIEYKYSSSHLIGFCRISLSEILNSKSIFFKKCSVLNENDDRVGFVTLRIEITDNMSLGRRLLIKMYLFKTFC